MKINYRPEIDGLRAISVLAVIFYHLEKILSGTEYLKGGYLGVDVFFVISGYLIGSIIIKEIKINNNFSFINFYERRARRILPALFFIILISTIVAYLFYLPSSLVFFSKSIFSSLVFISNIFFWKSSVVYNAEGSAFIPFLHTWSLSVEEQYYIIFPIIVIVLYKLSKKILLNSLIFLLTVSLFLASWASLNYSGANFYILITRFWEILFGSLIAYFEILEKNKFDTASKNKFLLFVSFSSLFLSFFLFTDQSYHPSLISLIPILSVVMIIWFSTNDKKNIVIKILSSKFLVGIGLISYSLYLWHYPIFVFFKTFNIVDLNSVVNLLFINALIFILSIFTFFFVEKPFRSKKFNPKVFFNIIVFSFLVLVGISTLIITKEGFPERSPEKIRMAEIEKQEKRACDKYLSNYKFFCTYNNDKKNKKDIILLGDSVANSLLKDLVLKLEKNQFKLINLSKAGALYTPNGHFINNKNGKPRYDRKIDRLRDEFIKKNNNEKVFIILNNYEEYFKQENFIFFNNVYPKMNPLIFINKKNKTNFEKSGYEMLKQNFREAILNLAEKDKVILFYPIPTANKKIIREVNNLYIKNKENEKIGIKLSVFLNKQKFIFDFFNTIEHKNIIKIYPHKLLCEKEDDICVFYDGKNMIYYDKIHFTSYGSKIINNLILRTIKSLK